MGSSTRRSLIVFALLGAWCVPASAQDDMKPDPLDLAATAVTRAVDARDDASVRRAASARDPDPWLVAEVLLVLGRKDAATRLAAEVAGPDGDGLRRRVDRGAVAAPATLSALKAARAAVCQSQWAAAVVLVTRAAAVTTDDPPSLALRVEHARALAGLNRHVDATKVAIEAAGEAEVLGWLTLAARARHIAAYEALLVAPASSIARWHDLERVGIRAGDDGVRATALEGLATANERCRDVLGAITAARDAVALREHGGEPGPWARAEATLGSLLLAGGDPVQARDLLERAVRRAERAKDVATMVAALAGLGAARLATGEPALAVGLFERAATLARPLDAQNLTARVLVNLANARRAVGDTAAALEDMRAASDLFERTGDAHGRVRALLTETLLRTDVGDAAGALAAGEAALRLARSNGDQEGARLACTRLACGLLASGDTAEGERILERCAVPAGVAADPALVAARRVAAARSPEQGRDAVEALVPLRADASARHDAPAALRFLLLEAAMKLLAGDPESALADYETAAREADFGGDGRLLATALAGVASAHLAAGRPKAALATARDAQARIERLVRGLADGEGALARAAWADVYEIGAAAAIVDGDVAAEHAFLEAGRAGALLEALGGRAVTRALEPPAHLLERAAAARSAEDAAQGALDGSVTANEDFPLIAERRRAHEAAAARTVAAEEAVQRAKKEALAFYPRPAPLPRVQATLAPGDVLVVYARVTGRWGALVVDATSARHVALDGDGDVRAACELDPTLGRAQVDAALATQRRLLVEPLALPADAKRVLVVPDDATAYVPFGALLPDHDVAFLPSGTTYLRLLEDRPATGRGVLAVGNPDYVGVAGDTRGASSRLAPLPQTGLEAQAVGDVTLLGPAATVPRLRAALVERARWHAVHLACHGVVDTAQPVLSALYLTATSEHDGRLRACDLLRETIDADLVVLSACETARGAVVRAEGMLGLCRAVMHAGVPRVVASLWKVDDEATRLLMTAFHARWKAGVPAARALREAQAVVRADPRFAHPTYWAAWVLWGLPD